MLELASAEGEIFNRTVPLFTNAPSFGKLELFFESKIPPTGETTLE